MKKYFILMVFVLFVVAGCEAPLISGGQYSDAESSDTVSGPREGYSEAGINIINLLYYADQIEADVLARYQPVSDFLGDGAELFRVMATSYAIPPNTEAGLPRGYSSLSDNFLSNFPGYELVYEENQHFVPPESRNDLRRALDEIEGLIEIANSTVDGFKSHVEKTTTLFNDKLIPGARNILTQLGMITEEGLIADKHIQNLVDFASKLEDRLSAISGSVVAFVDDMKLHVIMEFGQKIMGTFSWVVGFLDPLVPDPAEVKVDQLHVKIDNIIAQLEIIEERLKIITSELKALGLDVSDLAFYEVVDYFEGIRTTIQVHSGRPTHAWEALHAYSNIWETDINGKLMSLIRLSISNFDAYLGFLKTYNGTDNYYTEQKKQYTDPIEVEVDQRIQKVTTTGKFNNGYFSHDIHRDGESNMMPVMLGDDYLIPNPNRLLPTSVESLQYILSTIMFRLEMVAYLSNSFDDQNYLASEYAKQILYHDSYLPRLRNRLIEAFNLLKAERIRISQDAGSIMNSMNENRSSIPGWTYNGSLSSSSNYGESTYYWTYYFWDRTVEHYGIRFISGNGEKRSSEFTLQNHNGAEVERVYREGAPVQNYYDGYNSEVMKSIRHVYRPHVQIRIDDADYGEHPLPSSNFNAASTWTPVVEVIEADYYGKAQSLMHYAALLAGFEMYLESFIGS